MSDTPRTDEEAEPNPLYKRPGFNEPEQLVDANVSRAIERELASCQARERALRDEMAADQAELAYWRTCNADIMRRKEPTDGLSHLERLAIIRMRAKVTP